MGEFLIGGKIVNFWGNIINFWGRDYYLYLEEEEEKAMVRSAPDGSDKHVVLIIEIIKVTNQKIIFCPAKSSLNALPFKLIKYVLKFHGFEYDIALKNMLIMASTLI